jgi:hypothetical protein
VRLGVTAPDRRFIESIDDFTCDPAWRTGTTGPDPAASADELLSPGRAPLFLDPATSLEVLSPTAHSGRAALFEAAGPERSRFGVSCGIRPRYADL